jgi:enoyl-CoA hydratase/carnithine racemase
MTDTAASSNDIEVRIEGAIAIVALNRPKVRNAMNDEMRVDLIAKLDTLSRDDNVRALVITGNGDAFCAGGDIKSMQQRLQADPGKVAFNGWQRQQRTHHAVTTLHNFGKPTIAAVNGPATGLGADLAFCCDFVLASDKASFAMTYIARGLIPDGGGMYFLPRRVGLAKAKELFFSCRKVEAQEALQLGMADRVCAHDDLLSTAVSWATEMSAGSLAAIALTKAVLNQSFEKDAEEVFALGSQAQAICYTTAEHRASVEAFLTRRAK